MSSISALKSDLDAAIDQAGPDGLYDDATFERIHACIKALVPLTPTPRPIDAQEFVQAPWGSRFAQFGMRHTAGKPIRHLSKLSLQSFNRFPAIEIQVESIDQEIRVDGHHYNNVISMTTPDGQHSGRIVVWGRYELLPEEPQRYRVSFYACELVPPEGVAATTFREQFGLQPDLPLKQELKPPKLHSDVVFCDADMRINFGSMGGVYVMRRLTSPGKSVDF
ncbi:MAG: hypothetical protein IPG25_07190 [Proteobacteria bacterium]|nr:hypothetical protein [Pseudomonadota bacterium]